VQVLLAAVLAVLAAASNALASVGQRAAARQGPQDVSFRLRMLRDLARRPVWWAGIAGVVGGALFQGSALIFGPLALVQPILMVELPFTLVFAAAVFGRRLDRRSTAAMLALTAGIVLLLVAVSPSGGVTTVQPVRWLFGLPLTAAVVAALAVAGRAVRHASGATLLGAAAAVTFALTAALMKDATDRIPRGAAAFFGTWQLYATGLCGLVALVLLQNAYQSGPLAASQPALTLGDAVVSLVYSVVLFDERLRLGWWTLPAVLGVAMILGGALGLARSPLVAATTGHAEGPRAAQSGDAGADRPQWMDRVSARPEGGTGR
jgi:drug/metabolite transporter (DMT)-like permease